MTAVRALKMTYAEYLAHEEQSPVKHEWLRGEAWAMAGRTIEHGRLALAFGALLMNALRGKPCVVLSSNVGVRIDATDRTTYPDLTVVCGKRETSKDDPHAIVNPTVIVEVLSEGTERDDRGQKFAHYRHLASLEEYVLVGQDSRRIEGWILSEAAAGETIKLRSLGVDLAVDEVYFDPAA